MVETTITSHKVNHLIDPVLEIWGWEVGAYLFLGGLTAGCLVLSAILFITGKQEEYKNTAFRLPLLAPIFISIGMGALFLDLEYKINVWRFYTSFQITSPMSWGAWILLLVYPLSALQILGTIQTGYPSLHKLIANAFLGINAKLGKFYTQLVEMSEKSIRTISAFILPVGISLGIYTGILLSAFNARPFWNNSIMGPLFLVSGISTAAAISLLFSMKNSERYFITRVDIGLIIAELVFLGMFIISMVTGPQHSVDAIKLIMGGELTHLFWIFVIGTGLLLPLFLEILEMLHKDVPRYFAPMLILIGGLLFRLIVVHAGQINGWISY